MAHAPSLLFASISSLPSLLYPSSSEDSSTANIKTRSPKEDYQDLLESPTTNASHWPPICEPVVGIYADVNLREVATRHDLPQLAIDPAILIGDSNFAIKTEQPEVDTLADVLRSTTDCSPALVAPSAVQLGSPDFSKEAIDAIVAVLSRKREEDAAEEPNSIAQMSALSVAQPQSLILTPVVGLPQPMNAPFGEILVVPPPPPLFTAQGFVPTQHDGRVPLGEIFVPQVQATPPQPNAQTVDHGSPVLNAHLGIELDDLRQRADGFRARNPGRDIDKNWLQCFAGRLSSRGELIDDYRCYVNGCSQTNRRRDHILVHVGSHVEYRPFTCSHCGMRFLRKNECKRHESSHGGLKPYHCELCGQGRSFVRQDLLKRHMRVTHGVQSAPADRRKRLKVEEGGYWP
ncbi:uncharacterized protein LAESUDRAFT_639211 [Laetiporus sulphureus 93-53]|uniref:C2H2-type domain-containing protein n=1 Tax=Laetiporus sulphureus 93-53 TaxID=1314785 RepID=A0A165I3H5_9APHY|nr:uncharacterized protein LAESUDRAFT_639211 [Laetiporus sulphureus 93-53]KZT12546.1 hypothetical protein LAESUDRAFT_639211 [Laetiporus sulphureus 93-53]